MDMKKLWRCTNFFVRGLLTDRKYTFSVKAFQTSKKLFNEFYMQAKHMATFQEYLRIEGTFVRRQLRKQVKLKVTEDGRGDGNGKRGDGIKEKAVGGGERKPKTAKFMVHFVPTMSDKTFGKRPAEGLVAYMKERGIERLFLVTSTAVTPQAQKVLQEEVHVEYWPMLACLCEAERHYTVPEVRRLTVKEKKAFYAEHSLTYTNMARMLVTERMARYWDFLPGDLIHIRRRTHVGVLDGEMRVVVQA